MDQHPIPRQITTFEFKLIGFMTLRQFLYLLVALPTAYIIIQIFPIPILNILLGVLVAVAGIVTAFLPIKDRTLDVWAKNLWKRLQNPTQYYYHKKNDALYFLKDLYFLADPHHMLAHIESKEKLAQYLSMTKQRPKANYAKKQVNALLQSPTPVLAKSVAPVVPSTAPPPTPPAPTPAQQLVQNKPVGTSYVAQAVVVPPGQQGAPPSPFIPEPAASAKPQFPMGGVGTYALHEKKPIPAAPTVQSPIPAPSAPSAQVVPAQIVSTPPQVPSQVTSSAPVPSQAPVSVQASVDAPTPVSVLVPTAVPQVQVIPPAAATVSPTAQPATSVTAAPKNEPFFAGVIRTSKKIPLPGVLVYVKDPTGNPLRILKTNPHGVFATFNPLPAGMYTFEIKDPNGTYFFDTMNMAVKDSNPLPFEFQSKEIL